MANDLLRGRQTVLVLTNKSGSSHSEGAVVVVDTSTAASFDDTTTSGYAAGLIGVVIDSSIASNATGRVCVAGYVPKINLASSASLGDFVKCHTVAGQGTPGALATGSFAQVLGTGTTPAAWLVGGMPVQAGSVAAGTVTSVAMTVPTGFAVSGSPVTTSGTLAVTESTQSANLVKAGPTSGGAATPTYRALVPADLTANVILQGSASLTFGVLGDISGHTSSDQTMTVTGAAVGDVVYATPASDLGQFFIWSAWVSATNTVTVRVVNTDPSTQTCAGVTWKARVFK